MRALRLLALAIGVALLFSGPVEAKRGGQGGGRGKGKAAKFSSATVVETPRGVRARASSRFSSSFPPGHAWGLRRNRGEPVPLGSPLRRGFPTAPLDGQRIFRAGREWEFDSEDNRWILLP